MVTIHNGRMVFNSQYSYNLNVGHFKIIFEKIRSNVASDTGTFAPTTSTAKKFFNTFKSNYFCNYCKNRLNTSVFRNFGLSSLFFYFFYQVLIFFFFIFYQDIKDSKCPYSDIVFTGVESNKINGFSHASWPSGGG